MKNGNLGFIRLKLPNIIMTKTYKCPFCKRKIETVDYSVLTSENGTAHLSSRNANTQQNAEITEINDYNSNNTYWYDDPSYTCYECDHPLLLNEIIVKKRKKPEPKPEPENAIESPINLIIRHKNRKSYDLKNLHINVCPKCTYTFCPNISPNTDYRLSNEIIFCPKCLNPIDQVKNELNNIKKITS